MLKKIYWRTFDIHRCRSRLRFSDWRPRKVHSVALSIRIDQTCHGLAAFRIHKTLRLHWLLWTGLRSCVPSQAAAYPCTSSPWCWSSMNGLCGAQIENTDPNIDHNQYQLHRIFSIHLGWFWPLASLIGWCRVGHVLLCRMVPGNHSKILYRLQDLYRSK